MEKSRPVEHEFLAPDEWESWNALMLLHRSVLKGLDAELRREHGLAVTDFDVLITLFNAPDRRLRMSALADRVLLSPAGTTHLVTRLERDRMVRREVDPTDRRKWFTVLTEEGISRCAPPGAPITTYCDGCLSAPQDPANGKRYAACGNAYHNSSHTH